MKEIVNMNIGSQVFATDKDACSVLEEYLREIRNRLPVGDVETLVDIEVRMAEIFREHCTSSMQVVTLDRVRAAMVQMGSPADFGEARAEAQSKRGEPRKLYRSPTNRSIAGICGGMSEFFGIDATLLRIVTLLLIFFGGLSIWVYIILWIVIPEAPVRTINLHKNK